MPGRVVYFNGELVTENEARVSIFDSALMFGDMAFEMTRTYNGKTFKLREHLERLYGSLRLMEIDCGMTIDEMEELSEEILEKNKPTEADDVDWQIMHDVSRGVLGLYTTVVPAGPTVSINCWPLITHMGSFAPTYDSGVNIVIPAQQTLPAHLVDPKAKTRSRLHYQMANLQAARQGNGWPVLLDPDGFLSEGTGNNVFLVRNGKVYTPEPRNILLGVSRGVTLDLCQKIGIEAIETNLGRYEGLQADEIFVTGTTFALCHAASFEGQTIGDGNPGPVFQKLMAAWQEEAGIDFVDQARDYGERLPAWVENEKAALQTA